LKAAARAAGTRIVSAKFFYEFLIAMDDPETSLDMGFRWESFAALTAALERRIGWYSVVGA
jgi:hypothetical protein